MDRTASSLGGAAGEIVCSWELRVSHLLRVCGAADEGRLVRRPTLHLLCVSPFCALCAHILAWMIVGNGFFGRDSETRRASETRRVSETRRDSETRRVSETRRDSEMRRDSKMRKMSQRASGVWLPV